MTVLERFPTETRRTFEHLSRVLQNHNYTTTTQAVYLLVLDVVMDFCKGDQPCADRIIDQFAHSLHVGVAEASAIHQGEAGVLQPPDNGTLQ